MDKTMGQMVRAMKNFALRCALNSWSKSSSI